jgi:hypothetical protein
LKKLSIIKIMLFFVVAGVAVWAIVPFFVNKEVAEISPERSSVLTAPAADEIVPAPAIGDQMQSTKDAVRTRLASLEGRNGYSVSGTVQLNENESSTRFVRFNEDFEVGNGPDLLVYIGTADDRGTSLGPLRGNIGSQNYEIPSSVDIDSVDTIRIFCRAFNVDFAIATL